MTTTQQSAGEPAQLAAVPRALTGRRAPRSMMAGLGLAWIATTPASAATLTITCARADMIVAAWTGPLTLTYTGDAIGTLVVKAPYFGEMSVPAKIEPHTITDGTKGRVIRVFTATKSRMPELAALEACIEKAVPLGQAVDADSYDGARDGCLSSIAATPAPVSIMVQIDIGIFRDLMTIEMKRTYEQKTKAPKGKTSIESYPAQCGFVEK